MDTSSNPEARLTNFSRRCCGYFCGVAQKETQWQITHNKKKVDHVGICRQRAVKILNLGDRIRWSTLVSDLFDPSSQMCKDWIQIGNHYIDMMEFLERDDPLSISERFTFQRHADLFGDTLVKVVGPTKLGNYMHYFTSGHVFENLNDFDGHLKLYWNQNMEGSIKRMKEDRRNSQHGGGGRSLTTVAEADMVRWSRRWMPCDTGILSDIIQYIRKKGLFYGSKKRKDFLIDHPYGRGFVWDGPSLKSVPDAQYEDISVDNIADGIADTETISDEVADAQMPEVFDSELVADEIALDDLLTQINISQS